MMPDVAGPAIRRVHADLEALLSRVGELAPGTPAPRVTLDLPGSEPEPLHAFVWGTAREFGVAGLLTGSVLQVTFHVWATVDEIGAPQVKAADAWGDADGRRHAGYLLDFEATVRVPASHEAARIIKEIDA